LASPARANESLLNFAPNEETLTQTHQTILTQEILPALKAPDSALEVIVNATAPENKASLSRRISLSRGLAIRTYLTSQGIAKERIYLYPLGSTAAETKEQNVTNLRILQK
jgi:outer membrane protein OmpA-like peptidoglycan-associated protein